MRPSVALGIVVGVFAALSLSIAVATPAWEANDEPDHVRNVERLVAGEWYRIEPGAGFEAHQAPLYYAALAGWQALLGAPARLPQPPLKAAEDGVGRGIFQHDVATDGEDQRLVGMLRLPNIALGILTIVLTASAARRLSDDPWTPVVAAALVAGVPKFVFLSGVVNNDNLSNTLGAALTLSAVAVVARGRPAGRRALAAAAALGALVGLLVVTKLSAVTLGLGAAAAVLFLGTTAAQRVRLVAALAVGALVTCGWWLVQNQVRYGDPLAAGATKDHLRELFPPLFVVDPPLRQAFLTLPQGIYESFWYTSGWNQFSWQWWAYVPLWLGLAAALAGLVVRASRTRPPAPHLVVLVVLAVSALSTIWILGLQTSQTQARVAFMGLPAIACLAAAGLERLGVPVLLRFALPVLGMLGTFVALQRDVIDATWG